MGGSRRAEAEARVEQLEHRHQTVRSVAGQECRAVSGELAGATRGGMHPKQEVDRPRGVGPDLRAQRGVGQRKCGVDLDDLVTADRMDRTEVLAQVGEAGHDPVVARIRGSQSTRHSIEATGGGGQRRTGLRARELPGHRSRTGRR